MTSEPIQVSEVFFSYAHKDERPRNELEKHLTILKRQGYIKTWHDRKIVPGKEWEFEINKNLDKANIILLLISPDFLASDYCDSIEVKQALMRHDAGACCVIPIILRPVYWKDAPFSKLQVLPTNGKAVTEWQNRDKAFLDIAEGIRRVIQASSEYSETVSSESTSPLLIQQTNLGEGLIDDGVESHITSVGINDNSPRLTVQEISDAWENIIRRTRQRSSGTLAAMLRMYKIVDVEGTAEQPIVVIQSEKRAYYKYATEEDRYKVLEWSLTIEFGLPCFVRLVPPG